MSSPSLYFSRLLTQELKDEHDMIFALARDHHTFIQKQFERWEGKLFILKEYAGIQDETLQDVEDPGYFPVPENYLKTALEIKELVEKAAAKLTGKFRR